MLTQPKVIDLFSGVGGLSLGAAKAGFNVAGAVEFEKRILDSHSRNFPQVKHIHADVSTLNGKTLLKQSGVKKGDLAGLIGGPPCQGFSTIGKRNIDDTRNKLFFDFFRLVTETMPAFFLAENVPGILNAKYDLIRNEAFAIVDEFYDIVPQMKIVASEYGAATTRTRVFFIGVRKDVKGAEQIANAISLAKITTNSYVQTALEGLPVKVLDEWDDYFSSWQPISKNEKNNYLAALNREVDNIGDETCLHRFYQSSEVSGSFGTKHSTQVALRYSTLLPGQQDSVSKSVKLKQNGYCPTLRAGTAANKGSFQAVRPIHPVEARVITPREAARLQGFPDWFQFHETKWHSFRQIGNSVCPIAAERVLSAVANSLKL